MRPAAFTRYHALIVTMTSDVTTSTTIWLRSTFMLSPEHTGIIALVTQPMTAFSAGPGVDGRVGTMLARRFRLRSLLGQGGMGLVYEADTLVAGPVPPLVAIKVLRPEHVGDENVRGRFLEEGRACMRLLHPNVIHVYEVDVGDDGCPFLVMDRVQGLPLSALAPPGHPLQPVRAIAITQCVLAGLGAAHAQGIVHRDLKPENVLVGQNDAAKILDFGIAKVMDAAGGMGARTRTGMLLGTPAFMAPEQARSARDADHRSDLWSVAVMLYEILTGRQPFVAPTEFARLTMILTAEPDPPSSVSASLTPFDAFFQRALQKDRAHRFQSAAEMSQALAALRIGSISVAPPGAAPAQPTGPTLSSKHSTLESKLAAQSPPSRSHAPPPPVVVMPSSVQDPTSFAGDRPVRGVSQIVVVLLVCFALMAGFVLGFAVARSM